MMIRFEFIGEPALDAGGVAREFFSLICTEVIDYDSHHDDGSDDDYHNDDFDDDDYVCDVMDGNVMIVVKILC